uniref:carbonic anhydrase n=1 Tax=Peronospora matthiolae TaxID=2874970 RepID=A0AAV1TRC2_9STRA
MKLITSIAAAVAACGVTVSANVATSPTWGYHNRDASIISTSEWHTTWAACGGNRQSPIDINTTASTSSTNNVPLVFHGDCPTFNLAHPHEPLEVSVVPGGNCGVSLRDQVYDMKQFHMHSVSEHTINGKHMDAEIHFVHVASESKALLVVAVFLDIGPVSDEWLGPVLDALDQVNCTTTKRDAIIVNLSSYSTMISKAAAIGGVYNYAGSLTIPGCEENADWWVVESPIKISSIDFGRLHQDLVEYPITDDGNNARPVQPLNGRVVTRYIN